MEEFSGVVGHDVAIDRGVEAWTTDFGGVEEGEDGGVWDCAEAFEGVGPVTAVGLADYLVVDGLIPIGAVVPSCCRRAVGVSISVVP